MSKKRRSKYGPRLKIVGQFIPHPAALIRILRGLSPTARRILDTLELEHCRHGGRDNGRLRYTYDDFEDDGISAAALPRPYVNLKMRASSKLNAADAHTLICASPTSSP